MELSQPPLPFPSLPSPNCGDYSAMQRKAKAISRGWSKGMSKEREEEEVVVVAVGEGGGGGGRF